MKNRVSILIAFCLFTFGAIGQTDIDFDNFKPLRCKGKIPESFVSTLAEKYDYQRDSAAARAGKGNLKLSKEFLLRSNYEINNTLFSGKLLFGDPISEYVNQIADEILKDNPKLRNELEFYATKSSAVNAFSTDQGVIMINIGLISQLSNESELAFIMCHEIIHYLEKHNIKLFIENDKIANANKEYKSYKNKSIDSKLLEMNQRSKDVENEADVEGLELYLKTNYDLESLQGVFDVLQYSYLPYDEIEWNKAFFNYGSMKIPEYYYPQETNPIKFMDDYDDSKSTHPSIPSRREQINEKLEGVSNAGRMQYIIGEAQFEYVRDIARFECLKEFIITRNYLEAVYNGFILQEKYPNNEYIESLILHAFYHIFLYKANHSFYDVVPNARNVEGESHALAYALKKMTGFELNVVGLRMAYEMKSKYPENKMISQIYSGYLEALFRESKKKPEHFREKSLAELMALKEKEKMKSDSTQTIDNPTSLITSSKSSKKSKYDRIREKRKKKKKKDKERIDTLFTAYAFVDVFQENPEFKKTLEEKYEHYKQLREAEDSDYNYRTVRDSTRAAQKNKRRYGLALGIDKIIMVDPVLVNIDERKKISIKYIESEKKERALSYDLQNKAKAANLNVSIFSLSNMDNENSFNKMALLKEWLRERLNHNDEIDYIPFTTHYLQDVLKTEDTKYCGWMMNINVRNDKPNKLGTLLYSTLGFYFTLPFGIWYAVAPSYTTHYYYMLFDIETGKMIFDYNVNNTGVDKNAGMVGSYIYDTFYQIQN